MRWNSMNSERARWLLSFTVSLHSSSAMSGVLTIDLLSSVVNDLRLLCIRSCTGSSAFVHHLSACLVCQRCSLCIRPHKTGCRCTPLSPRVLPVTALSDLLVAAKGDRSVDDLIAAAEKRGAELEPTFRATAYKALKGDHAKSPRESTLRQLCQVFGLDIRRVREAVQKPPGELGPWTPTPEADRLS